jgi:hypothetical protein
VSGFLRFEDPDPSGRPDPYKLFGAQFRRSRLAMETAYDDAFAAWDRRCELMKEHDWSSDYGGMEVPWSDAYGGQPPALPRADLDRMWDEALAENVLADCQASIVLLVADDAMQRFARGVLGENRDPAGYGPAYGAPYKGLVQFTRLLRAGTNAVRHVSEWDDIPWNDHHPRLGGLAGVYPTLDDCKLLESKGRLAVDDCIDSEQRKNAETRLRIFTSMRRAMESITVFQQVFGLGIGERIRDPVSFHIITAVDGRLGNETSYSRFEEAMLAAARDIAAQNGPDSIARLQGQLA